MAFPADTNWTINSFGASNNGGAFSSATAGGTGLDWSQLPSPEAVYTDLSNVATGTQLTSAAGTFADNLVGNGIYLTGGGATDGCYMILSKDAPNQITIDRSPGSGISGTTGRVGGAQTDIQLVFDSVAAGNYIWISGTHTLTSGLTFPDSVGTAGLPIVIEGFTSTHGDATYPVATIDANSGAFTILTVGSSTSNYGNTIWKYLTFQNTSSAAAYDGVYGNSRSNYFYRCRGYNLAASAFYLPTYGNNIFGCEAHNFGRRNATAYGFYVYIGSVADTCFAHIDNASAVNLTLGFRGVYGTLRNCIAHRCYWGYYSASTSTSYQTGMRNFIANQCVYGTRFTHTAGSSTKNYLINAIGVNSTFYAFNKAEANGRFPCERLAAYNSGVSHTNSIWDTYAHYLGSDTGVIDLAEDPFVDSNNKDFRLKASVKDTGGNEILHTGFGSEFLISGSLQAFGPYELGATNRPISRRTKMQQFEIVPTVDKNLHIFIENSASDDGSGLTGLLYNTASLSCYYKKNVGAATQIPLQNTTLGNHTDGGFIAVDGTNMPGWYELQIPDACIVPGFETCMIEIHGAANMAATNIRIIEKKWLPE